MKKLMVLLSVFTAACAGLATSSEYIARGNGYIKDGRPEAAINAYNKAVELNPKNLDIYEARAAAYFYNGQYELATRDFERVLKEDPYRLPVYTAYASTLAAQGYFESALEILNHAVRLRPDSAETYFARAGVLFMLGRYDQAVADYTRTLEIHLSADVLNARGIAYQQWGQAAQAKQDFEAAKNPHIPQHLNDYAALK